MGVFNLQKQLFQIINCIKKNRNYLLVICGVFVLGIISSFLLTTEVINEYFDYNIFNSYIFLFDFESPCAIIILKKALTFSLILLLFFIFSFCKYTLFIHFIFIFYQGFLFAIVSVKIIILFSLSGILTCVLVLLPVTVLKLLSLSIISVIAFETLKKPNHKKLHFRRLLLAFFIAFILNVITFSYELIIISCILRPLNLFL